MSLITYIVLRLVHHNEVRGTRDKTIGTGVICYNKTPKWSIFKLSLQTQSNRKGMSRAVQKPNFHRTRTDYEIMKFNKSYQWIFTNVYTHKTWLKQSSWD